MEKNQTRSYILYALGEIVLVVIGILIALQINNWNEGRKNKNFERETLEQIAINLKKDKDKLRTIKSTFKQSVTSSKKILESEWTNSDLDSLKYWLADIVQFERFYPLTNAYEVVKSKGLDLIRNKDLRFQLGTYYDDEVMRVQESIEDIEYSFATDWLPIMKEQTVEFKFKEVFDIKDYTIFTEDSQAKTILKINRDNYGAGAKNIERVLIRIEELEDTISEELKNKH